MALDGVLGGAEQCGVWSVIGLGPNQRTRDVRALWRDRVPSVVTWMGGEYASGDPLATWLCVALGNFSGGTMCCHVEPIVQ